MILVTRYLWQHLQYPTRQHPLFRVVNRRVAKPARVWTVRDFFLWLIIIFGGVWLVFNSPYLMLVSIIGLTIVMPAIVIFLNGTGFGFYWAIETTHTVANLGKSMAWDLLQATPLSAYGGAWLVTTGRVHRGKVFRQAYQTVSWTVLLTEVALFSVIALMIITWHKPSQHSALSLAFTASETIRAMGLVCALWFDHIQSVLLGCLVGMISARLQGNPITRMVWAGVIYVSIKILSFVVFWLVYALGEIAVRMWIDGVWFLIITGFMLPLFFFVVHEAMLSVLWRVVLRQYEN